MSVIINFSPGLLASTLFRIIGSAAFTPNSGMPFAKTAKPLPTFSLMHFESSALHGVMKEAAEKFKFVPYLILQLKFCALLMVTTELIFRIY